MPAQDFDAPSHEDKVYFTAEDGYTYAGKGMADKIGGHPMKITALLNPDNLEIDEDTKIMHDYSESELEEQNYFLASLATHGTVAHKGDVHPNEQSAPQGESFILEHDIQNDSFHSPPASVRRMFHDRHIAASEGRSQESTETVKAQYEAIKDNFDTQISAEEAGKLLARKESKNVDGHITL
jgi:hypothetical protein